ncbi:phosphomethylpyrimidine kinase/thiamin-phosphate pyrophosphorylase [Legionella beliardensis]|uniref:Thiamine-phosphate synthase n=1 Tax=Legionella beliardensis TaxID=91822 RepID=A0A378HYE3_9GAMM|nr:thiamine phosphate synthase [Legionella beliardensis]STX27918.1 phosphomethylpyrimidine kinase/thiamin-phosphate pyrophosphorylase [Legionella beliardensis]
MTNKATLDLCLVTQLNDQPLDQYLQFLELAIKGGVTLVQYRDKNKSLSDIRNTALALKSLLAKLKIPFIINDYVELAADIDADGVHIGQSDLSPWQAHRLLGPDKIIGYSIESFNELNQANQLDCIDYIAASAVFPSQTKTDCKTIWQLAGLKEIAQRSKHPVVAIGGINASNVHDVIKHGANGVAVISAIHDCPDPFLATRELIKNIQQGKSYAI